MLGACSLGCGWMLFCELDGRVLGGMQFGTGLLTQSWRGHRIAHSILAWAQDCPKNPSPGQRRRSVSDAVLAASLTKCFFHHSHAQPSILAWAQDCPTQSWRGRRIASLNPGAGTGLLHSILAWAQDCPGVSLKTLEARLYTETHSRTCRPDCPKNSVSVLLCSRTLTDSPPGFPASNLASNAKEWGRSSCFLRYTHGSGRCASPKANATAFGGHVQFWSWHRQ